LTYYRAINEDYSQEFVSNLRDFGIYTLSSKASTKVIELFWANNIMEDSLREKIQKYIERVASINLLISNFNTAHPRYEKYDPDIEKKNKQDIKDFLSGLTKNSDCKEIIRRSYQPWNIWWLIRDNAMYESINIEPPFKPT
jgi:hypothetical protein